MICRKKGHRCLTRFFVSIASDEHAMLFKLAHGAAVVMTGEGW
jgi:hypothetical protein